MARMTPLINSSGSPSVESGGARNNVVPNQAIYPAVFAQPGNIQPGLASQGGGNGLLGLTRSSTIAAAFTSPLNPKISPIPWIVGSLVVGYAVLHYVHFRER